MNMPIAEGQDGPLWSLSRVVKLFEEDELQVI